MGFVVRVDGENGSARKKKDKKIVANQSRVVAGQIGAEAADKFKTAKAFFGGVPSAKIPLTPLKTLAGGAALGIVQSEVTKGQVKKAIKHGKTAVRAVKAIKKKFK
jgi:hypothetical protein